MKRFYAFLFIVVMTISVLNPVPVKAFSLFAPFQYLSIFADTLQKRVSDIVYYLSLQKKYLFGEIQDPNVYDNWPSQNTVDQIVTDLNIATSSVPRVNPGAPVVVATTTIPEVRKPIDPPPSTPAVEPAKPAYVPALVFPPIVVPTDTDKIKITLTEGSMATDFDSSKILIETNLKRNEASLSPLSGNRTLDRVAALRLADLFDHQYFAHESPTGKSAPDLAKSTGYSYLIIGENLALGNFDGDRGIVEAWMDSPGHRANILNPKYRELGVAKRLGEFKGDQVTIAVQIFANPQSTCARPTAESKSQIDRATKSIEIAQSQAREMLALLNQIKDEPNLDRSFYNQKVQEYNYYAKSINEAVIALRNVVNIYNTAVADYNNCIKS